MLTGPQQRGLSRWEPAAAPAQLQQQADAAAAAVAAAETGQSEAAETYELLQQLPGLQRSLRRAAQEGAGLPDLEALRMCPEDVVRLPRKKDPELSEWDLRAKMEKRRRQQRETEGARGVCNGWHLCEAQADPCLPAVHGCRLLTAGIPCFIACSIACSVPA